MARRRSTSSNAWLAGLLSTVAIAVGGYYMRVVIVEKYAVQQLNQIQAAQQRMQDIQQQRIEAQQQAQAQRVQDQLSAATRQAEEARIRAAQDRAKDAAWNRFYREPKGCDNWKTDQQMVECLTYKTKAKTEFDGKWAAGELTEGHG